MFVAEYDEQHPDIAAYVCLHLVSGEHHVRVIGGATFFSTEALLSAPSLLSSTSPAWRRYK